MERASQTNSSGELTEGFEYLQQYADGLLD
jgi:hypothetical protein